MGQSLECVREQFGVKSYRARNFEMHNCEYSCLGKNRHGIGYKTKQVRIGYCRTVIFVESIAGVTTACCMVRGVNNSVEINVHCKAKIAPSHLNPVANRVFHNGRFQSFGVQRTRGGGFGWLAYALRTRGRGLKNWLFLRTYLLNDPY